MRADYGRTINDLLLLKGDIAGRSAAAIGQARAREQEILGQLWGQAINNVGQIAASVPQQLQERRRLKLQEDAQRQQLQERQALTAQRERGVQDDAALDQAFSPAAALGPQGVGPMPENAPAPTRDQILNAVPGHLRGKVQETFAEADKLAEQSRASRQRAQKDAQEYAGFLGAQIHQAGYDPHIAMLTLDHAAESHQDDPEALKQIDQMRRAIQQDPNVIKPMAQAAMLGSSYKSLLEPKTREIRTRNADGSEAVQIVKDEAGQQFNSAPVPEKPPTAGSFEDYVRRYADGKKKPVAQLTTADIEDARKRYQQSDNQTAQEPLMAILGPDGKSVYVPRPQAIGKQPANAREQGRPVTSGDANKIADFDTSLDDLGRLTTAIGANGATGVSAQIGASVPNAVTDLTGIGTDAKQKQALIDRVKQVIGKALEGGVLRKEDEVKYEKILPTISDTTAVVTAKLDGLKAAITQRRERTLENLADAGYDTSRFATRAGQSVQQPSGGMIEAFDERGQIHHAPAGTPLPKGWRLKS